MGAGMRCLLTSTDSFSLSFMAQFLCRENWDTSHHTEIASNEESSLSANVRSVCKLLQLLSHVGRRASFQQSTWRACIFAVGFKGALMPRPRKAESTSRSRSCTVLKVKELAKESAAQGFGLSGSPIACRTRTALASKAAWAI